MARLLNSIQNERGLRYNGTTQATASASTIDLSAQNKITISFWMKLKKITSGYQSIVEFGNNNNTGFFVSMPPSGVSPYGIFVGFVTGADWYFDVRKTDGWMHIVTTIDRTAAIASVLTGYINGSQSGGLLDSAGASAGNFGNLTLYTGAQGGSSLFSNQSMKDLRIYSGILTPAQIRTMYEQGPNKVYGSPLVWYKMDEGTGTTLANSGSIATASTIIGRTTTGTAPSTMWIIDPVRPPRLLTTSNTKSVLLNGTSDKIVVADNAALNVGTGDFTYEFKVNLKSMPANTTIPQLLFGKRESAGSYIGWENYFNEGSLVNGPNHFASNHRAIAGNSTFAISNVDVTAGKWYHVVVSVTRATQELYRIFVNGILDTTYWNTSQYSAGAGSFSNAASLTTGGRNGTVIAGPGMSMYDERLYTRALTDDECLSRYYTNENITSGRVGWWNMQEGSGAVITDSQGTNNGTLTGGTWTLNAQS